MLKLSILSGGAAAGVVNGIRAEFEKKTGCQVVATFSAVGAMRDLLLSGEPCDLIILTKSLIDHLVQAGRVVQDSSASLGIVRTGVAIKVGEPIPSIATRDELLEAFKKARGIYFPDPEKATAGIHVASVIKRLGLQDEKRAAWRIFPDGATAMAAMADSTEKDLIGSTQVTEINITPGVQFIGMLPKEFELATDYCVGICTDAKQADLARNFASLLTSLETEELRKKIGFELGPH